ncbi:hypothetical protein [Deinococcus arcticus]|nr:hypothetical protein [Deinococcus arcticus]
MPKKKDETPARDVAGGAGPADPGGPRGQQAQNPARASGRAGGDMEATEPRTERMRLVTLGLGRNLAQIRWAWEHPAKAYDHVSVPMQLVMTLLGLVVLCPLEEMVFDLADDELTTRRIPAVVSRDLDLHNPEGFVANLPRWRRAVATGRVELFTDAKGRKLDGVRAWLPPSPDTAAWTMTLDTARLAELVTCLTAILPAWGTPPIRVTLPPNVR